MKEHSIYHRKVTSLWPEANGKVERQNRSILRRLTSRRLNIRTGKRNLKRIY